jgi:hypothetical protein
MDSFLIIPFGHLSCDTLVHPYAQSSIVHFWRENFYYSFYFVGCSMAAIKRKSTIADLEDCLHQCFQVPDVEKIFDIPEIREAVG